MSDAIVTDLLRGDDDARLAPATFSLFIRGPVSGFVANLDNLGQDFLGR